MGPSDRINTCAYNRVCVCVFYVHVTPRPTSCLNCHTPHDNLRYVCGFCIPLQHGPLVAGFTCGWLSPASTPGAEQAVQQLKQRRGVQRLAQDSHHAGLQAHPSELRVAVPRDSDHGHSGVPRVSLQAPCGLTAVELRHHYVRQDQIKRDGGREGFVQSLHPAAHRADVGDPQLGQLQQDHTPVELNIVDDQNADSSGNGSQTALLRKVLGETPETSRYQQVQGLRQLLQSHRPCHGAQVTGQAVVLEMPQAHNNNHRHADLRNCRTNLLHHLEVRCGVHFDARIRKKQHHAVALGKSPAQRDHLAGLRQALEGRQPQAV
eukprot:RCo034702